MFKEKKPVDALSDNALQQIIGRLIRRRRHQPWITLGLLTAGALGGISLGMGFGLFFFGTATWMGVTGIALSTVLNTGGGIFATDCLDERLAQSARHSEEKLIRESTRRAELAAAAENLLKRPLDSGAAEAFTATLTGGTSDKISVRKPLQLNVSSTHGFALQHGLGGAP